MLEKYFKKDKTEQGFNIALIIIIVIIAIVIGFKNVTPIERNETNSTDVDVKELMSKITDNYTVAINVINSKEKFSYNYTRDSQIELIDEGDYSDKVYIVYNNKYYSIDVDNFKLTKVDKINRYNHPYTNINLIREMINVCEFESVNENKKSCTIKTNIYFNEYNSIYKTDYNSDEEMTIDVSYYSDRIRSIVIDYTNIDKIINDGQDILKYELVFTDIGKNNYTEMANYYKKYFKK